MMHGRAIYASDPERTRGRYHAEPASTLRSAFQRDRDRIVHATAFRRLEYKTQVFVNFEGDHFRTRLTHSIEVAQIARTLARALALDEDLAEAIALAHDLGHTPFGHAGEAALSAALADFGGFDHNLQTFRVVTGLERRYAAFDGLNLTFETLEGIVKHNGPLRSIPAAIAEHDAVQPLLLDTQPSLEAQAAAIADDVAYCSHDLDDGLRAGILTIDDLLPLPILGDLLRRTTAQWPGLEQARLIHECLRGLIDLLVGDLVAETRRRLAAAAPGCADAVRVARVPFVAFSPGLAADVSELRGFLRGQVYSHYKVNRMTRKARRVVRDLFDAFVAEPECLPDGWRELAGAPGAAATAEIARDYIAGMTDRFAIDEHDRLYKLTRYPA